MKNIISFLFTRNDKLQTSPFMIILLGLVIVFAIVYFVGSGVFGEKNDEVADNTPPPVEEEGEGGFVSKILDKLPFADKITGTFSEANDSVEDVNVGAGDNVPEINIPTIPSDILDVDESLLKDEVNESSFYTELKEADIEKVGRRDPMKKIVGEDNGSFSKKKNKDVYAPADQIDDSKGYFEGVTLNDIVLDNTTYDKYGDNKFRGTFIVEGSVIPDLEAGDYILELYYIKKIDDNSAIIEYKGDEYKLGPQKIIDKTTHNVDSNGIPRKK